jgi:opacity protein-like surface antigen
MRVQRIAIALMAVAGAAGASGAQSSVRFGVGAGGTLLGAEVADLAGSGFHGMGMVSFRPRWLPVDLRFDVVYNVLGKETFSFIEDGVPFDAERRMRIIGGTLGAVVAAPGSPDIQPYVLAGVGLYHTRAEIVARSETFTFGDEERATKFGVQGGGGLRLRVGRVSVFAEGRIHYVPSGLEAPDNTQTGSVQFMPLTVGVVFGGAARSRPGERR